MFRNYISVSSELKTTLISLAGGLMTGEITEFSGPSGAGKTQLCLAAAISVARYVCDCPHQLFRKWHGPAL
jgi:RecA/RadA recombinase